VHGNESVSSEAVMQVIYDLLDTRNAKIQGYLNNTVVLLDPCINPDGRERYVQWYNQVAAKPFDISPYAREHFEPWPGGRANHYLFDLNRDWAWMTQQESQQRIALYNQWMPHLHADFHEQAPENPYYFSPAAKPFHQEITPFQRKFQNVIGDYNRKYFDANGWLYFTRERFDLFYPSYGDTWNTFNGAIGMTYEQGGSGRAGLGLLREEGDTLTLKDRIAHHHTASIATLEAVSSNSDEITREFVNYFKNTAATPPGEYRSYVFKAKGAESRLAAFTHYLDRQGIRYGYASNGGNVSGYRYQTGKTESAKLEENDLVVSAFQPKAVLLKVLMEPNPPLEDSVTYDITSWALPYSFGLDAYATKTRLTPGAKPAAKAAAATTAPAANGKPYAYLAPWKGLPDLQFLAALLRQKVKVRYAEAPFETGGQQYPRGTLIITRTGNEPLGAAFDNLVGRAADSLKIALTPVASGFVTTGSDFGSDRVRYVKAPRVALMGGSTVSSLAFGEVWHYFEQQVGYPVTILDPNYLSSVPLSAFDVLILPSGSYGTVFNDRSLAGLKDWVRAGGKLIALEGAVNFFADKADFEVKRKKPEKKADRPAAASRYDTIQTYANRERESLREEVPGAVYRVTMDETHPLSFGYGNTYYTLLRSPIDFEFLAKGWNVGYLKKDSYVSGFAGSKAKEKLKDTFVLGVQELGRGQVVYINSSPLFRAFWQSGKLLFGNAVFLVGSN
ncbi:MAG: zinc carboxypeptidase, partial [Cytophagales bacterium]|nr:zinc carboxypeptidase [Cytophagales bacterium]